MDNVISVLESRGPLIGKELALACRMDTFNAWKKCTGSELILTRIVSKRYLRLDAKVEDFARLSPSIMREFLNYTVVGLPDQAGKINERAKILTSEITSISRKKIELARESVGRLIDNHKERDLIHKNTCFIIAGDVVFNMAHSEPRPESSTGELVKGSDLDIICVTENLPPGLDDQLDDLFYREKYNLLMNPAQKEELDYVIKDLSLVSEQLQFNDFKKMVASKILDEGLYLYGSRSLFARIKKMVETAGIPGIIRSLEIKAVRDRVLAEQSLLEADEKWNKSALMALFYTTEEKEEIF
ncbi:MAG: hypothetical protein ACNA7Z_00245 [Dethiobacteria bacterium]